MKLSETEAVIERPATDNWQRERLKDEHSQKRKRDPYLETKPASAFLPPFIFSYNKDLYHFRSRALDPAQHPLPVRRSNDIGFSKVIAGNKFYFIGYSHYSKDSQHDSCCWELQQPSLQVYAIYIIRKTLMQYTALF